MFDKRIAGLNTKILIFTIVMGIFLVTSQPVAFAQSSGTTTIPTASFSGVVTKVVDGDTIDVDNIRIRLALVNSPKIGEPGYTEAKDFTKGKCVIGAKALVDEDDNQQRGSYGRTIGLVYCGDDTVSLNQQLVESRRAKMADNFCSESEFSNQHWAIIYGCR